MRSLRSRAGQIVIPALFVFPSLMLFVYLIYETAKLSREKIRHQFALDAAAFVEMTNYSDFLNRTAYVNGPFPMRIFEEGFKNVCIDCDMKRDCKAYPPCSKGKSVWDILWGNGAFPRAADKNKSEYPPSAKVWDIGFAPVTTKQDDEPVAEAVIEVLKNQDADMFWINWDDANNIYKLYVQIYQLLGSVEEAQWSVLTRLTDQHSFFKKSYWLNTGDPIAEADAGAMAFHNAVGGSWSSTSIVSPKCHQKITFWGNKPTGSAFQPWLLHRPENPVPLPESIKGCGGLFAVMHVKNDILKKLQEANPNDGKYSFAKSGIGIKQSWTAPGNFFNHDFNNNEFQGNRPFVHVTVGLGPYGRVWPNPTPKFQVRTYP